MFPHGLHDILLQELDLVGDTARPVCLWDHRRLHHPIHRLNMRLFPWGWLLYFQLTSRLLQYITQNIPRSSEHKDELLKHDTILV
jgi:hypothetical protein